MVENAPQPMAFFKQEVGGDQSNHPPKIVCIWEKTRLLGSDMKHEFSGIDPSDNGF